MSSFREKSHKNTSFFSLFTLLLLQKKYKYQSYIPGFVIIR
jgi:hypothetical protein